MTEILRDDLLKDDLEEIDLEAVAPSLPREGNGRTKASSGGPSTNVGEGTPLVLDPLAPLNCARAYIIRKHTREGMPVLIHHRGEFSSWTGQDFRTVSDGEIRCALWGFLDGAAKWNKGGIGPFKPNKVRIGDILDALRAAANVPETVEPPAFLDASEKDARNFLALHKGLLDVISRKLIAHTPRFFNRGSADYDFDPAATCPIWEKSLDDWFDDDLESRNTLEEILGLLLIQETKYHKLFLLVGPRRSGKGTFGRLIPKLLGPRNVVTPTMANLGDHFGLQDAIGKSVAVIGDARLKADAEEVAERLLTISGADGIAIPRKYLPTWNGSLGVRFVMLSNETPQINDPSGALASRFVVVQFTESFLGREDLDLDNKLEAERSGILNRCLDGLLRLTERGRFLQPTKGLGAIEDIEALGSPLTSFLDEMTEKGSGYSVSVESLYRAWRQWCERNGRDFPGNSQRFGRDLRIARGGKLEKSQHRHGETRLRYYEGLRLK